MSTDLSTEITFAQSVTDKVRKLIMDSMPEEKLQAALQAEYDKYFVEKQDNWSREKTPSHFQKMVESEIRSQLQARIQTDVSKYLSDNVVWNTNERTAAIIAGIAPVVMDSWVKAATTDICRTFINGMMQRQY